jgi:hypothetical protein
MAASKSVMLTESLRKRGFRHSFQKHKACPRLSSASRCIQRRDAAIAASKSVTLTESLRKRGCRRAMIKIASTQDKCQGTTLSSHSAFVEKRMFVGSHTRVAQPPSAVALAFSHPRLRPCRKASVRARVHSCRQDEQSPFLAPQAARSAAERNELWAGPPHANKAAPRKITALQTVILNERQSRE